jgi:signal transduction histidine kinase
MILGSILVMAALSSFAFRRAMQSEIAENLRFSASVVKERVDTFLFTQVEDMRVWRMLQVMQDIRVGDVDKRISNTLSALRAGQQNTYEALICTDGAGRIIAASDPALIGTTMPQISNWKNLSGTKLKDVSIARMKQADGRVVVLRTAIPDAFRHGVIGNLFVLVKWDAIEDLLDNAVRGGPRSLLLLGADGRVLGASNPLRHHLLPHLRLQQWPVPATGTTSYIHDGSAIGYGSLLVGAAASAGDEQFNRLGWHILMVEPTSVAFRPVWNLLWGMLLLLLLTLMLGVWIASRLAGKIAQPIVNLTEFTRRFRQGNEALPEVPATTMTEVAELFGAYVAMIEALDRSRENLVRAGKLAVIGEMAAVMAHEIRTPMSIVRSSAQLLERQPAHGDEERELIGFILSETERLNRLVTMLLECARPKPPDFRPHDLHSIIDSVINLIASRAETAEVTVERDLEARAVMFNCDREQMMQVLLNLVLNALEMVQRGGKIAVSTWLESGALWLSVADDGPGVPLPIREHIFDPFFTRRQGGIGLGLTVVQQIVHAHGGEIGVTDSSWGGAAFNVRFDTNIDR